MTPSLPFSVCAARWRCPQVNVGNKYNRDAGLSDSCLSRQGDFQSLPFEDGEFDAAYQIEATCHSPDKVTNRSFSMSAQSIFRLGIRA